ncbi:hypothetical protein [Pontibacter burrus]|uniref:Uncharacterized protein n=1 Tax=Pontibacter burrus TaxID=2704466 RepID=A0A6B3LT81_9BACT|nr:hypothetical protein [Pontibacter burrus]NEM96724.1 hypothetical protein [Pontibacter burrus]
MKKMSHTYAALTIVAALVRANLSGWYLLLALLLFSLFMSGCQAGTPRQSSEQQNSIVSIRLESAL